MADLLFLVDGSWSVGKANFKHIRALLSATASAFQIGQDRTRVGVVQYSSDARVEFALDAHPTRPALLRAISVLPHRGGDSRTGSASLAWPVLFWSESLSRSQNLPPLFRSQDTPSTSSWRILSPKSLVPARISPRCWWC